MSTGKRLRQSKLSTEQREALRQRIRQLVEARGPGRGIQSRLAEEYDVTRSYINQIVVDERTRFANPVSWERDKAKRRREKVNLNELYESLKDHPALQTRD